jgi:ubiquinone/menaquinone biosynthesis C-methylase UbiE
MRGDCDMPIDFHADNNRFSYAARQADASWIAAIQEIIDVRGKKVADIACGGGIYAKALASMGATSVTGVDFSEVSLKVAQEYCRDYASINFATGNALNTGLSDNQFDLVLERALIHHLTRNEVQVCFAEALRLLNPGGILIVQDRTPGDCLLPGSTKHIRGYLFSRYPKLIEKEIERRFESEFVISTLQQVGFQDVERRKLWEIRKIYPNFEALRQELLARTGRSILHELTDEELQDLTVYIQGQLQIQDGQEIIEKDRWTIWSARKGER